MSSCIFCKIAGHEIPSNVIFEDDDVFAFHDINPQAPTHAVVISKRHIDNIAASGDADAALLGKLMRAAAVVAVETGVSETGFRVVINNGADGGQSVDHLHVHVLGGRKLAWPPG
ncbi:MAG TPA: histidine triad nucleotide-binding protein [Capsulimonadaceae bacterium]|jgi:histidine triad (HIT) family protein